MIRANYYDSTEPSVIPCDDEGKAGKNKKGKRGGDI